MSSFLSETYSSWGGGGGEGNVRTLTRLHQVRRFIQHPCFKGRLKSRGYNEGVQRGGYHLETGLKELLRKESKEI